MHKRPGRTFWKNLLAYIFLLLASNTGYAQLGIGGGFEYGTSAYIYNGLFIGHPSIGVTAVLSYAPRDSRVFPSISYLLKNSTIPVENSYYPKLRDIARGHNFALNLNYRTTEDWNYYLFFVGIGISKIQPQPYMADKYGNTITLVDTLSSGHLYPMAQVGFKYMHRILGNSSFYLGAEANLKYIRMHSDNVYYLQQGTNSVKATIGGGEVIAPGLQIHLDYFFDRNAEY